MCTFSAHIFEWMSIECLLKALTPKKLPCNVLIPFPNSFRGIFYKVCLQFNALNSRSLLNFMLGSHFEVFQAMNLTKPLKHMNRWQVSKMYNWFPASPFHVDKFKFKCQMQGSFFLYYWELNDAFLYWLRKKINTGRLEFMIKWFETHGNKQFERNVMKSH